MLVINQLIITLKMLKMDCINSFLVYGLSYKLLESLKRVMGPKKQQFCDNEYFFPKIDSFACSQTMSFQIL